MRRGWVVPLPEEAEMAVPTPPQQQPQQRERERIITIISGRPVVRATRDRSICKRRTAAARPRSNRSRRNPATTMAGEEEEEVRRRRRAGDGPDDPAPPPVAAASDRPLAIRRGSKQNQTAAMLLPGETLTITAIITEGRNNSWTSIEITTTKNNTRSTPPPPSVVAAERNWHSNFTWPSPWTRTITARVSIASAPRRRGSLLRGMSWEVARTLTIIRSRRCRINRNWTKNSCCALLPTRTTIRNYRGRNCNNGA
mmetsp:Transcript_2967/g.6524  ORF Transcript_2967/g.6524 Transcript_2967/m.6524 type:complete len:255 (+) Transcript_2967:561-1325(+)